MARGIFDGSDPRRFALIHTMRVGYDSGRHCFTLTLFVTKSPPPNWLGMLVVELEHDTKPCSIRFTPEWTEFEAPHIRARLNSMNCVTGVFDLGSAPFIPIKSVKLIRGNCAREFPNASSTAAFLARPLPKRDAEDAADT